MIDSTSSDDEIAIFLQMVKAEARSDVALAARLARVFADSGERFAPVLGLAADVASTGGPSSLSTLLCPLFLRSAGLMVPKLGVPGRPAGGIDCLAQIDGFRYGLLPEELERVMQSTGYAHFFAAGRYAPLDARVFKLRQLHRAQQVPTLVMASLLAKKLAVGVKRAGLDVRVAPHGNFGSSWDDARTNSKLFVEAAQILGIDAFPVLTEGRYPYQPYIGRGEALVALSSIFDGTASPWLLRHLEQCRMLALAVAPEELRARIAEAGPHDLQEHFFANVIAQQGSPSAFNRIVQFVKSHHIQELRAFGDGFFSVSMSGVRKVLVQYQIATGQKEHEFTDPVGGILLREPGEWVRKGDVVATIRVVDKRIQQSAVRELSTWICRTSSTPMGAWGEGVILDE
jgi:thymidine phosphorylase